MRKRYKRFLTGALAAILVLAPVDAAYAKTEAVVQTDSGEQIVTYYTVNFHANKGKKVKTTLTLTDQAAYGKLPKTTRAGYEFKGWYTKKSGGKKVTAKTVFTWKDDQTLYAHWKKVVEETEQTLVEDTPQSQDTDTSEVSTETTGMSPEQQETPAVEATESGQPEEPQQTDRLVAYIPNIKTDYKNNNYSGFFVLKNFKAQYLYCQYDYDRFIGSSGKNVGCTATADAMLASIYMDKLFSPNDEGWVSGVGATWTNSVLVDGSKLFSVKRQCQEVYDYLNEGKPVLIRVIGHSVTAIGVRVGVDRASITPADILIADPTDAKVKCADEMGYRVMTDANGWGLRIPKASLPAK